MTKLAAFCCLMLMAILMLNAFVSASEKTPAQMLETYCTSCHDLERVRKKVGAYDLKGWENNISHMQDKGSKITDAEAGELANYLAVLKSSNF